MRVAFQDCRLHRPACDQLSLGSDHLRTGSHARPSPTPSATTIAASAVSATLAVAAALSAALTAAIATATCVSKPAALSAAARTSRLGRERAT